VTNIHQFRYGHSATILWILAVAVGTSQCASWPQRVIELPVPRPPALTLRVEVANKIGNGHSIQTIPVEDYVRGSVPVEMPLGEPDGLVSDRLARLQAILARTYALANLGRHADEGFDLCSTTHCQVYSPPDRQLPAVARLVTEAVERTRYQIITDGHGPILAVFHSDCGGHTSAATVAWGGPAPAYLLGVPDDFCVLTGRNDWQLNLDRDQLRRILNANPNTQVGARLDQITILDQDSAGRATRVSVVGEQHQEIRGEQLRAAVSRQMGARAFRSARFSVERKGDVFHFRGNGFGHGIGLCQTGAIARARQGEAVETILTHYYPGTWLEPYLGTRTGT
jgi:stage II sporulation protein D